MIHSGAGDSGSWDALHGPSPETHWYNLKQAWIDNPSDKYNSLPIWWRKAIENPGEVQHVKFENGSTFACFDPKRRQMLSGLYDCPQRHHHHLYMTCRCCGQYG